jgi:DNA-binding MarR family transcriptional regulator
MNHPIPTTPLLRSFRIKSASRSEDAPKISDYPHLALAATATTAGLDTTSETFHAVQGCLETLCRLRLSKRAALLLIVLARHGPLTMARVADALKVSQPNCSLITRRIEALGLIALDRQGPDLRRVHASITEAGRKVLASIIALTGLAGASAVLLRTKN